MRTTDLARIALQAEKIRLRRYVRMIICRIACAVIASILLLLTLGFVELAGYQALCFRMPTYYAALAVAGANLIFTLVLLFITFKSRTDRTALEARAVRDDAWRQIRNTLMLTAAAGPLARVLGRKAMLGVGVFSMLARMFASRR